MSTDRFLGPGTVSPTQMNDSAADRSAPRTPHGSVGPEIASLGKSHVRGNGGGSTDAVMSVFGHWADAGPTTQPSAQDTPVRGGGAGIKKKPDTVQDYIGIVKHMEKVFPNWTGEQIMNNLRTLGNVDNALFMKMYGMDKLDSAGVKEKYGREHNSDPTKDQKQLEQMMIKAGMAPNEIAALERMSQHNDEGHGTAKDSFGEDVALSHVLTGISAGMYRNKNADLVPSGAMDTVANLPLIGPNIKVDNLYAATIAGDLGQAASEHIQDHSKPLLGPGSEASPPELTGDIDGFLMGGHLNELTGGKSLTTNGKNSMKFSDLLASYYDPNNAKKSDPNSIDSAHRYERMRNDLKNRENLGNLAMETANFSVDYDYKLADGLFGQAGRYFGRSDFDNLATGFQSVQQFSDHLQWQSLEESLRNTVYNLPKGTTKPK